MGGSLLPERTTFISTKQNIFFFTRDKAITVCVCVFIYNITQKNIHITKI